MALVLVTGGSGFIGAHCILQLLAGGHTVRATLRSLAREPAVREMLGEPATPDRVTFVEADLTRDAGWPEAARDCEYVLHVASPFPVEAPRHPDELVIPARDGTLRALRAARDAGVKRVVLTSSFAAIGYGHPRRDYPFDEKTWTNLDGDGISAYVRSKTVAERAAWTFVERECGGKLELATVNPVGVLGPVLGKDISTSIQIVQRMMNGEVPGAPKITFGVVDVRDVADLHILAMLHPKAHGERFLAVAGEFISVIEVANIIREMGPHGRRAPKHQLPSFVVRAAGLFDRTIRQVTPELGKAKNGTSAKARALLGWMPRTSREAILATAESLLAHGLVR